MKKQQGNSLLEIVLVIAVSSVLIVMAVRYFTVVDMNSRVAETISRIDILTRASYEWRDINQLPDFSGITTDALEKVKLVSESDTKSPWGGTIGLSAGNQASEHVKITLNRMSAKACENLRRHLASIAHSQSSPGDCKGQHTYFGEF